MTTQISRFYGYSLLFIYLFVCFIYLFILFCWLLPFKKNMEERRKTLVDWISVKTEQKKQKKRGGVLKKRGGERWTLHLYRMNWFYLFN